MEPLRCGVKGVYVAVGPLGASPAVVLSHGEDTCLPIYIGLWEAISIHNALKAEVSPRPLTHDLFVEFLNKLNVALQSLLIDALEDGIYYGRLVFVQDNREISLDCRPSDGIAICVRCQAPILVDPQVMADSGLPSAELPPLQDLDAYLSG